MASTASKKRARTARVADMTTEELQAMIEKMIDRKLAEWVSDPRMARRRAEIVERAQETRAEYKAGRVKRGTAQDLLADLDA